MSMNLLKRPKIVYTGKSGIIRSLDCIARGSWDHDCCTGTDCAHVKADLHAGGNIKDDTRMLPLCRIHHSIQHSQGEKTFYLRVFPNHLHDAKELADKLHILYLEQLLYPNSIRDSDFREACERFAA